jgi:hypothetical protein
VPVGRALSIFRRALDGIEHAVCGQLTASLASSAGV